MVRVISSVQIAELLSDWRQAEGAGYRSLADRLRLLVIDGRLSVGSRLPSERDLADRLDASRTTIGAAFDELRSAGYIETRRGSGSIVTLPGGSAVGPGTAGAAIDFTTASAPAAPGLHAAAERAMLALPASLGSAGYEFIGMPVLREAIAARFTARGLPTRPSQIMVTSGAQTAIALVARTMMVRGDRAIVESPGYPHAYEALKLAGARLIPLAVDADHGWDALEAEQLMRRSAPTLAYLIPDFHNPTGRSMPVSLRERLLETARDVGTTIVVDETTAELDIDRLGAYPPMASLASPRARVITIGSASKIMWGGLRIGWIRASEDIIAALAAARPMGDLGTAILEQLVAAELFTELPAVLAYRRSEHVIARAALRDSLTRQLPDWHLPPIDGGLAAWVRFDAPVSSQLAIGARERGLRIAAGPWFGLDGAFERFIRIPFGPGGEAIERAVGILADVWEDVADAPRGLEEPLAAVV